MSEQEKQDKEKIEEDFFVKDFVHKKRIKMDNGNEYEVGFKEISGYEDDRIKTSAMKYNQKTGEFNVKQEEANLKMLMASLVEAPFGITEDNLKKLSKKVKDQLVEMAKKVNTVEGETAKK